MRAKCTVWLVILIAGCSSTGGITTRKPTFQATTSKLDETYASCVLVHWKKLSPDAHMLEFANGFEVVVPRGATGTEELLMVRSRANGADVTLYEWIEVLALRGYRESAHDCL
ncbi:hypothetical protein DVT68_04835 [Dyella solisilvae]|uniref:Lipoprotein n=1 Tax=Dyella solisilvae TaxID=1920168 RepID=A0A370KBW5_9GAMM|nr:hypothetical protein [Dyella solisilvae]RDJ00145.1 hypothetical protein DVT68_04835 [Dyella solisilvae]